MSANDRQHGGSHYSKHAIQSWDFALANNIPYMEATAIKYLVRWRDKDGIRDLQKAIHFIEKLIEWEQDNGPHGGYQEQKPLPGKWVKCTLSNDDLRNKEIRPGGSWQAKYE